MMQRRFVDHDWVALAALRPEYANAERVWNEVLQPELQRRDSQRFSVAEACDG